MNDLIIGSKVELKKGHPCGANHWEIVRLGADVKIKCLNCGHIVMIPRIDLIKKIKKVII
jgi:hypothetical protein